MRRSTIVTITAFAIAAVFYIDGLNRLKKSAQAAEAARPAQEAPEGYVLVKEDILNAFVDSPGEHFHKAKENFLKKDYKASAEEIRKGIAFLRLQAARANAEGKEKLDASIAELDKLADNVEKGTVTSVKTLDQDFAQAHYALAKHHYLKAVEEKSKGAGAKVGHDLKASAAHLKSGFKWTAGELEGAAAAVINDADLVAGKLIDGTGFIGKRTGDVIDKMGVEIEKLGKVLESKKHKTMAKPAEKPVKPTDKTPSKNT